MRKKIAHEAPLSMFNRVQEVTDYDYALVHLFEESEEYLDKFKTAKLRGREVLLDNSIFELGHAFDADKFKTWVTDLNPDWYIIPDVLEDAQATVRNVKEWRFDHPSLKIAVVQGKSYDEIKWCYQEIEPLVDKVAISFDYSFFVDETINGVLPTKYHHYMYGRDGLIHRLLADEVINQGKPHHLLGCGLPQEFDSYFDCDWIDSIDTSNPIVAALKGMRYDSTRGLEDKPSQKLFTMMDYKPSSQELQLALYNIECFRAIVNG